MNCKHYRRFLYAFADGELGEASAADVAEHLAACAECSRTVEEHRALRTAVFKGIEAVAVPEGLAERIRAVQRVEPDLARVEPKTVSRAFRWRKLARPMAAAASIVLVAGAAWWFMEPIEPSVHISNASPLVVAQGPGPAATIAQRHRQCSELGAGHHNKELPRDLRDVRPALEKHFSGAIAAMTPDLSRFGYALESANYCGLGGPGTQVGGHVIYASRDGDARVSIFSLPKWNGADTSRQFSKLDRAGYRQCRYQPEQGGSLSILTWRQGATTYVCCGVIDMAKLKSMVRDIRVAVVRFDDAVRLAMVSRERLPDALPVSPE